VVKRAVHVRFYRNEPPSAVQLYKKALTVICKVTQTSLGIADLFMLLLSFPFPAMHMGRIPWFHGITNNDTADEPEY